MWNLQHVVSKVEFQLKDFVHHSSGHYTVPDKYSQTFHIAFNAFIAIKSNGLFLHWVYFSSCGLFMFFKFFYSLYKCDFPLDRIDLVETIPLWMDYGTNATFGVPLYKAWKDLLSTATQQVDIASFYWSLTGEDIGVKSSTDQFVSSDPAI